MCTKGSRNSVGLQFLSVYRTAQDTALPAGCAAEGQSLAASVPLCSGGQPEAWSATVDPSVPACFIP